MTQQKPQKNPGEADRFRRGQEPLGHHRPELRGHHRDHGAGTGERQAAGAKGIFNGFFGHFVGFNDLFTGIS